jgi:cytochrome c556
VVPGEAIESEIKRLHLQLVQDLTTPIKFKTDYLKVRQSYSLLSMWFAIIFEYDGEVRWKQAAAIVQPACWRAAANARTDGEQAYQYARLRRDELQELIRGGAFGDSEKPIEAVDWSQVVDRVPTMVQLENSLNNLKTLTASKAEFQGSVEDVVQQAAVIAAIGKVLSNETMEGGDDEGYRDLAGEMRGGATTLLEAVKLNDFDSASSAVNRIEQSCNKCHEDWR